MKPSKKAYYKEGGMNKTSIEWCRNPDGTQGYTWNPITGCLNHINGMCKGGNFPCYAYRLATTRLKERYLTNVYGLENNPKWSNATFRKHADDPFYPRFWGERLNSIGKPDDYGYSQVRHPKGIFVCDMSDLFGIGIPEEWTENVLGEILRWPQHRFYLLTKQPQNLAKFSPFPDNCWIGVTATNTEMLLQACSALEHPVKAKIKYLSIEPFLDWSFNWTESYLINALKRADINWLIIGAQTRPTVYPKIEWVEEIVEAADKAGVPVFLKENLYNFFMDLPHSNLYWADMSHLRQEMLYETK